VRVWNKNGRVVLSSFYFFGLTALVKYMTV